MLKIKRKRIKYLKLSSYFRFYLNYTHINIRKVSISHHSSYLYNQQAQIRFCLTAITDSHMKVERHAAHYRPLASPASMDRFK